MFWRHNGTVRLHIGQLVSINIRALTQRVQEVSAVLTHRLYQNGLFGKFIGVLRIRERLRHPPEHVLLTHRLEFCETDAQLSEDVQKFRITAFGLLHRKRQGLHPLRSILGIAAA